MTTNISSQYGTTSDDELLYTGGFIDGRGGDDTIQLRFGEDVTGSELAANLKNIETIDLSIAGDNKINGLSIEDVLSMTDDRNVLEIFGDSEDSVSLNGDWGTGTADGDYMVYTGYTGANNDVEVTLKSPMISLLTKLGSLL